MKTLFLIIAICFSVVCFANVDTTKPAKVDSLDMKVISMREFEAYLQRIDLTAKKQFDLTEVPKYEQILKIIQSVYLEADRKRRK